MNNEPQIIGGLHPHRPKVVKADPRRVYGVRASYVNALMPHEIALLKRHVRSIVGRRCAVLASRDREGGTLIRVKRLDSAEANRLEQRINELDRLEGLDV